jgi:hypothetical protein
MKGSSGLIRGKGVILHLFLRTGRKQEDGTESRDWLFIAPTARSYSQAYTARWL